MALSQGHTAAGRIAHELARYLAFKNAQIAPELPDPGAPGKAS